MDSLTTKFPFCFFCIMEETNPSVRKTGLELCFKKMVTDQDNDKDLVFILSVIWNFAMANHENPELISSGIFECLVGLIQKCLKEEAFFVKDQNFYIPYYAAHIIGSYTMKRADFARKAVESGVLQPLIELMRGKMSWVEQRVAVRAIGHLASYEMTFEAVAAYEEEVVMSAMNLASTCLDTVYNEFVSVKNKEKREIYHCKLLTRRGFGESLELENQKAEEWASQTQIWSIYLLNCFAVKQRCLNLICNKLFLKDLSKMWGGLLNHSSPAGIGLIRILCYSKQGRGYISESEEVILSLCNLSRSSCDSQYMGIDCLLLLLKDQDTRYKVFETAAVYLQDLVELKTLKKRTNLGDKIARVVLLDYNPEKVGSLNNKTKRALKEIWDLKVVRRKREKDLIFEEKRIEEKRVLVSLLKQQAKIKSLVGDIDGSIRIYNEAIKICPLKLKNKRMDLYSNRAECYLLLGDSDSAIKDCTRALCLSNPVNSHGKSLWTRSRAYDSKGLAKESLIDCIMYVGNGGGGGGEKIPYDAARMIGKQMNATWIFREAKARRVLMEVEERSSESDSSSEEEWCDMMRMRMRMVKEKRRFFLSGLSTIKEEPVSMKECMSSRMIRTDKVFLAQSM